MGEEDKCCICLESLFDKDSGVLGVTNPCGHPIHEACFGEWAANKIRCGNPRDIKCPTCNTPSATFTRIFINFPTAGLDDDDDDDDDDSSDDDEINSLEDNYFPADNNEVESTEISSRQEEAEKDLVENNISEGVGDCDQEQPWLDDTHSSRDSDSGSPSVAIGPLDRVNEEDTSENVVDLTEDDDQDLCKQGMAIAPTNAASSKNVGKRERTEKGKNSRRKAKRYKTLFQQMKSRYDELSKKQHELHVLVKSAKDDAKAERTKAEQLETDHDKHLHELRKARLDIVCLERELESAEEGKTKALNSMKVLREEYTKSTALFRKEIESAQKSHVVEVQKIMQDYPRVLDQKQALQVELDKKNKYVANLKSRLQSLEPKLRNNIEMGLHEESRPPDKRQLKKSLQMMNALSDKRIGKQERQQIDLQVLKARKKSTQRAALMVQSANEIATKNHVSHPKGFSNRNSNIDELLGGRSSVVGKATTNRVTSSRNPKHALQETSRRVSTESSTARSTVPPTNSVRHAPSLNLTKRGNGHKPSDGRQGGFSKQSSKSSGHADLRSIFQAKR